MKVYLLFIIAFLTLNIWAQPGGGGGLIIGGYYNGDLREITPYDTSLHVRLFILTDTSLNSKITQELYDTKYFLPPAYRISERYNGDEFVNERLLLTYLQDTMLIDFLGIIPGNGAGAKGYLDSVIFKKGYFRYFLQKRNEGNVNFIKHYKNINANFLLEKNLPATFYLHKGEYNFLKKKFELALADVNKSIEMGLLTNDKDEAILYLCKVNSELGNLDKAIANISELISLHSTKQFYEKINGLDILKDNYHTRIELFIKNNQLNKALIDYDSIVSISNYYLEFSNEKGYYLSYNPMYYMNENIERAIFKMKYLKDSKGAVIDLKQFISKIPNKPKNESPQGVSDFNNTYFVLALAEYNVGDLKSAFKHWLRAEELWYGYQNNSNDIIVHYDTLIKKHPRVPELYLSRGIAYYIKGAAFNGGGSSQICYEKSLEDLKKTEALGLTDFRIDLYRALVFYMQKKYNEALEQINISISKNDNDPRVFITRYWIRDKLGEVKGGNNKNDKDWNQYMNLMKNWKFEK